MKINQFICLYINLKQYASNPMITGCWIFDESGHPTDYMSTALNSLTTQQIIDLLRMPSLIKWVYTNDHIFEEVENKIARRAIREFLDSLLEKIHIAHIDGNISDQDIIKLLNYTNNPNVLRIQKDTLQGYNLARTYLMKLINLRINANETSFLNNQELYKLLIQKNYSGDSTFKKICEGKNINHLLNMLSPEQQFILLSQENNNQDAAINNIISNQINYNPKKPLEFIIKIKDMLQDFTHKEVLALLMGATHPAYPIKTSRQRNYLIYKNILWPILLNTNTDECDEIIKQRLVKPNLKSILKQVINSQEKNTDIFQNKLEDPNNLLAYIISYNRSKQECIIGSTETYELAHNKILALDEEKTGAELEEIKFDEPLTHTTSMYEEEEHKALINEEKIAEDNLNIIEDNLISENPLANEIIQYFINDNSITLLENFEPEKIYQLLSAQDNKGYSNIALLFKTLSKDKSNRIKEVIDKIMFSMQEEPLLALKLLLDETIGCFYEINNRYQQTIYQEHILVLLSQIEIADCPTDIIANLCSANFKKMLRKSKLSLEQLPSIDSLNNLIGLIVNYNRNGNYFHIGQTNTYNTFKKQLAEPSQFTINSMFPPPRSEEIKKEQEETDEHKSENSVIFLNFP